jgi:hypothetical protein
MKDNHLTIEYERPDWTPDEMPTPEPPFTFGPMPEAPEQDKAALGALVSLVGLLACLVGAIGWTLWGAA